MDNRFIVFEGIDRCGKRTQLELTQRWLLSRGCLVQTGSEPNDKISLMGIYIRRILKKELPSPGFFGLQRLFTIDRAQDVVCLIQPALDSGHFVLWERFAHSTLAYGMLEGDAERYLKLQYNVMGSFMVWPQLTLLLDISAEEGVGRMGGLNVYHWGFLVKTGSEPNNETGLSAVRHRVSDKPASEHPKQYFGCFFVLVLVL